MRCLAEDPRSTELLLAYCARRLDRQTAAAFEEHLAVCANCSRLRDDQQAVWQALDAWDTPPVSPDFNRRLYRRIEAEEQSGRWARFGKGWNLSLFRQGLPIAAIGCLLLLIVLLLRPAKYPPSTIPAGVSEAVQADQVERTLEDMELLREFHGGLPAEGRVSSSM